jgi:predicted HNH restriction endonuclease
VNILFDLSDSLLYLELMKKNGHEIKFPKLKFMLYFLQNYNEVKEFYRKIQELNLRPPFVFYNASLIHFIEDYKDCVNLKNKILATQQNRRRKVGKLFKHQIMLSKTEQEASNIMQEANEYGIELNGVWATRYDSMWRIKNHQKAWRESIKQQREINKFDEIYDDYIKLKSSYFESLSLSKLKQTILKSQENEVNQKRKTQTTVYDRSVLIKEFAKRVAGGVCQLCESVAPFFDKYGNPFLEVHHIKYLSLGGSDTIDNVVALCPNCHRKMHLLEIDEDLTKLKVKAKSYLDINNII